MTNNVAIDNDFLMHLVQITKVENLYDLIIRFFKAMDVLPEMHPLVYEKETLQYQNKLVEQLFNDKIINQSNFNQITEDPQRKRYYEMQIKCVYKDFTGDYYPCSSVCTDWKYGKSLGEVHTVVFCAMVGYDCFLSDDKNVAKRLGRIVKNRMSKPIEVKNRSICCEYIKTLPDGGRNFLVSKELKIIAYKRTN